MGPRGLAPRRLVGARPRLVSEMGGRAGPGRGWAGLPHCLLPGVVLCWLGRLSGLLKPS